MIKLGEVGCSHYHVTWQQCVCFSVTAVARLDTPAGGDWSGYNCRVVHSCGLQHRCDEHSSTRKAVLTLWLKQVTIGRQGKGGGASPIHFLPKNSSVSQCVYLGGRGDACVCITSTGEVNVHYTHGWFCSLSVFSHGTLRHMTFHSCSVWPCSGAHSMEFWGICNHKDVELFAVYGGLFHHLSVYRSLSEESDLFICGKLMNSRSV